MSEAVEIKARLNCAHPTINEVLAELRSKVVTGRLGAFFWLQGVAIPIRYKLGDFTTGVGYISETDSPSDTLFNTER